MFLATPIAVGFAGHWNGINFAAFSPDGRFVVTAGEDGTARVFVARFRDLMALAESRLPATFTAAEQQSMLRR